MLPGYSSLSLTHTQTRREGQQGQLPALAQKKTTDVKVGRARSGDQLEPVQPGQGSGTQLRVHKQHLEPLFRDRPACHCHQSP